MIRKRNTPAKTKILELIKSVGTALSRDEIEKQVKGLMDRVTIYRVLNSFCEDGKLHKVLADDGKTYFALCVNCKEKEHHHYHFHFRCTNCNKVECLNEEVHFSLPKGYQIDQMNCVLTGFCSQCAA